GGGGLIAGIAAYVKRLRPATRIIGVEPEDADAMHRSLAAGRRVRLESVGLFADGVAVKQVGELTFQLCRELVDEVITVDTDATCAAIKDVFSENRSILEPSGALAVAGMKAWAAREGGIDPAMNLVAILSGANTNFDRLRFIADRGEVGEQREAFFAVTIPERPGSFRAFCELLGPRSVTEFNYRLGDPERAHILVGLQVASRRERGELIARFEAAGLPAMDLSDNELAKLHIRHLAGGRAPGVGEERIVRFAFPERPGALLQFLSRMSRTWNISLFHYRYHGADFGRVLCAFQVPAEDGPAFQTFLDALGYEYVDEGQNPAYRLFLA
ncbi:MAG TPA: threonine ammonia-lyase, biosynthetic, partial [Holophaga sp.]|nr:threonine ammonia-lyase, biosynthetic [Holophaga sp.]